MWEETQNFEIMINSTASALAFTYMKVGRVKSWNSRWTDIFITRISTVTESSAAKFLKFRTTNSYHKLGTSRFEAILAGVPGDHRPS